MQASTVDSRQSTVITSDHQIAPSNTMTKQCIIQQDKMSRLGRGTGDDGAVREIQIQERERGVIKDIPKASREREDLARDVQMNGRARGVKIAAGRNSPTPPTARRIVVSSFELRCARVSMLVHGHHRYPSVSDNTRPVAPRARVSHCQTNTLSNQIYIYMYKKLACSAEQGSRLIRLLRLSTHRSDS
ncbi:hypothetical protein EYC84_007001 [Monilinia fructicola]|uniref:Uncharacterized protein n=1 Tax=Monilinia fructicola TaxID=38448 RepID=A0A5M9KDD6_MONFR|nr:hypothetical protein EYC84_007001 [Monilinia fructicola]